MELSSIELVRYEKDRVSLLFIQLCVSESARHSLVYVGSGMLYGDLFGTKGSAATRMHRAILVWADVIIDRTVRIFDYQSSTSSLNTVVRV